MTSTLIDNLDARLKAGIRSVLKKKTVVAAVDAGTRTTQVALVGVQGGRPVVHNLIDERGRASEATVSLVGDRADIPSVHRLRRPAMTGLPRLYSSLSAHSEQRGADGAEHAEVTQPSAWRAIGTSPGLRTWNSPHCEGQLWAVPQADQSASAAAEEEVNATPGPGQRCPATVQQRGHDGAARRETMNVLPASTSLSTAIVPSCASTRPLAIERPSPKPGVDRASPAR